MYFFKDTNGNWIIGESVDSIVSKVPCELRKSSPTTVAVRTVESRILLLAPIEVTALRKNAAGEFYANYAEFVAAVSDFFDNAPITSEEVDAKIGAEVDILSDRIDTVEGIANAASSGSLGSIKPTDAAPTPARNGNYTFSIGGAKPAWLTAEAGVTTVKAGDGVSVVFTAPSSYSYTHVDVSGELLRISEFNTYNNESSMYLQLDKLLGKFSEREVVSSNPNTFVDKYTGNIINLAGYYTKKYDISENKRYYCSTKTTGLQSTMAAFYDVNGNWLGNQNANTQSNVIYSYDKELIKKPLNTKFVIITSHIANYAEPYLFEVSSYAEADQRFLSSVLYNKKIACVGDSITHGSTASAIAIGDEFMPASGPQFKNFMYNIAKRNGLKWYNYGISGTTLGDCFAEGSDKNGFAKAGGRYTTMNSELDYILLMFGTNDLVYGQRMWTEMYIQNKYGAYYKFPRTLDLIGTTGYFTQIMYDDALAQTGTINGVTYSNSNAWAWDLAQYIGTINDSTNKTWYGAWNIVLPYLINKYPLSKILIWLNPTNTTFSDSTKLICKKWGIPFLDLHEDNRPLIWYKPNLSGYGALVNGVPVTTFRKNALTVDGLHPNDAGYEYLSTIIESELLKI